MLLVPKKDIATIFRNLTADDGRLFLKYLTDALAKYTAESSSADETEKLIHQPLRGHIVTKDENTSLFMPCSDTINTSIKTVTLPKAGNAVGVINFFSPSGELLGLIDATEVTAFRTALAVISFFLLASHIQRKHIVVFGAGRQVEWHIRLALLLLPADEVESFTVINRSRKRLEVLDTEVVSNLKKTYPNVKFNLVAKEDTPDYNQVLQRELAACDVIFGCTPSTEPLFPYSYLKSEKQRFISLIGSYKPNMKEIDIETTLSGGGTVFVDSKKACLEESGELNDAKMTEDNLIEIGSLFSGAESTDLSKYHNVIFKCVGMGVMDLVMGRTILELASQKGLGQNVEW